MSTLTLRNAILPDIPALLGVINAYASQGIMLPRTEFELAENIRDFIIAIDDEGVAGCGALHFYTPRSAEVRSLAVSPDRKGGGVGRKIVELLEADAREQQVQSIFAFTYVPGFFEKLGFSQVDRGELPLKAWKDCMRCPKFQACDEIPMLKHLAGPNHVLPGKGLAECHSPIDAFPILNLSSSVTLPSPKKSALV